MCLITLAFAALAGLAPRIAFFIYWIARPNMVDAAFNNFIIPLLGLIFLPFTTLFYVILYSPGIGLRGWDWLWLGLAFMLDVMHYSSTYAGRDRIPYFGKSSSSA